MVQWELAALLKYIVISLSSLAVTLLIYEFCVWRTKLTRWLFGMRINLPAPAAGVYPGKGAGEAAV